MEREDHPRADAEAEEQRPSREAPPPTSDSTVSGRWMREFPGGDELDQLSKRVLEAATARHLGFNQELVRLGDFELLREVGVGGMGRVFAARRVGGDGQLLGLKVLHRSQPQALLRLKREFRVLAEVEHPNLVALDQLVVLADGTAFFTMELVAGQPFLEYVRGRARPGQLPNQLRLLRVLDQLLAVLEHLHALGFVHRDLKPSNVLVTSEGRVVVLDFGLAYDSTLAPGVWPEDPLLGTPAYMAPEQIADARGGPAVDLYAVGVMLFQCLSGERPIRGRPEQARDLHPAELEPALVGTCEQLLAREPERRPSAAELRRRLAATRTPRMIADPGSPASGVGIAGFVGRRRELDELLARLDEVHSRGRPVTVLLRGASGLGKSSLLREFAARAAAERGALVLRGRCFERESLPYKGVDTVVDALSNHLRRLAPERLAALAPTQVGALVRLFPVLGDLWAPAPSEGDEARPTELRRRGFEALRELLAKVAKTRELVLILDDFQWAELESAQVLEALLVAREAPALLLIAAARPGAGRAFEGLRRLADAVHAPSAHELELGPLSSEDAHCLLRRLDKGRRLGDEARDALVREARGSPFFLVEMSRGPAPRRGRPADLERLLARRILALAPSERRALFLLALAGGPLPAKLLGRAGVEASALEALVDAELIARDEAEPGSLEVRHHRIGAGALAEIESEALPALQRELAGLLADSGLDLALAAELFVRLADHGRASALAQRVARQAFEALAFERAVTWFERSRDWLPQRAEAELRRELELELANAYANVGRLGEAADLLLAHAGADDPAADELLHRAGEYLLRGGHFERGLEVTATLIERVGLEFPRDKQGLLASMSLSRRNRRARLDQLRLRPVARRDPRLRAQIEACASVTVSLSGHEGLLMVYFCERWQELAIALGDPQLLARAVGFDAVVAAYSGDDTIVPACIERARSFAAGKAERTHRFLDMCEASTDILCQRWAAAEALLRPAQAYFSTRVDAHWELTRSALMLAWARNEIGQFRANIELSTRMLPVNRELGNIMEIRDHTTQLCWALARVGELDEIPELRAAMPRIGAPEPRYLVGDHFLDLVWMEHLLRAGELDEALAMAARMPQAMEAEGLWQLRNIRARAKAFIAKALVNDLLRRPSRARRSQLRRLAADLRTHSSDMLQAQAASIEAALADLDGRDARALDGWTRARARFEAAGAEISARVVDLHRARLLGGDEGRDLRTTSEAVFAEQRIRDPEGLIAILAPGPR